MKSRYTSIGAGLFLSAVCASIASAQAAAIQPEQEVIIRQYIEKQPIASIDIPDAEIIVGSTLPDSVELHAIDVEDVQYRYVVVNNRTMLVEPDTRRIVHILD